MAVHAALSVVRPESVRPVEHAVAPSAASIVATTFFTSKRIHGRLQRIAVSLEPTAIEVDRDTTKPLRFEHLHRWLPTPWAMECAMRENQDVCIGHINLLGLESNLLSTAPKNRAPP